LSPGRTKKLQQKKKGGRPKRGKKMNTRPFAKRSENVRSGEDKKWEKRRGKYREAAKMRQQGGGVFKLYLIGTGVA